MQKLITTTLLILLLSGCSGFPGVYKFDIPQGNVITQDMINRLRLGMTRSQVQFIMGTPLITDPFHKERWDYLYSNKSAANDSYMRERISIYFKDDKLVAVRGENDTEDRPMSPLIIKPSIPENITNPDTENEKTNTKTGITEKETDNPENTAIRQEQPESSE